MGTVLLISTSPDVLQNTNLLALLSKQKVVAVCLLPAQQLHLHHSCVLLSFRALLKYARLQAKQHSANALRACVCAWSQALHVSCCGHAKLKSCIKSHSVHAKEFVWLQYQAVSRTSNISVAPGGISPRPAPRAPYASSDGMTRVRFPPSCSSRSARQHALLQTRHCTAQPHLARTLHNTILPEGFDYVQSAH